MKVLSLFSGVGGFDMGLENAGMETVFQCEWDKHANSILYKHWPDVPKWDDVSTLTGKHILAHAPVVDVVAWGSPCQDLSVAGKRAGIEGARSGLFHEGIRIIKELQEETNGQYPRISIWENVVGALNSNRGADFGIILDQMAEAGALAIEWSVLDAQYFGIPQRRRRVFVIAIFDPVLASRCPSPLLPVSESLPGHLAKGKSKGKSAATTLTEGVGADGQWAAGTTPDGDILRTSVTSKWHKGSAGFSGSEYYNMVVQNSEWWNGGQIADSLTTTSNEQRMPDKQRFQAIVEPNPNRLLGSEIIGSLNATDYKWPQNQQLDENKFIVEPFVKSSRAQTSDDSETWIPGEVNPTLNSFDVGDTRATTAIVEPVAYHFDSLSSNSMKSSNPDSGVNEVDTARTLDTWRPDPSLNQGGLAIVEPVLIDGQRVGDVRIYSEPVQTLGARMGTGGNNVPMLAFDTQFGSNANVTEDIAPTLKASQQSPSVAFQYDGYNQIVNDSDVSTTIRIGRDSSDFIAQPAESTMAVRRLTPLECERLMGWPDDHTRHKADGTEQADTHRYKQCGNGVASPVAQWIAKHILNI